MSVYVDYSNDDFFPVPYFAFAAIICTEDSSNGRRLFPTVVYSALRSSVFGSVRNCEHIQSVVYTGTGSYPTVHSTEYCRVRTVAPQQEANSFFRTIYRTLCPVTGGGRQTAGCHCRNVQSPPTHKRLSPTWTGYCRTLLGYGFRTETLFSRFECLCVDN